MGSPLQAIMSLLQAPRPRQPVTVRPDYGLTGASVQAMQRSPYERTLSPGQTRSPDELRDMLAEVILAAGGAVVPGVGPKGQARQAPARVRPGFEKQFKEWFGGSKIVDEAGNPKTVYHATRSNFTAFDKGKLGSATGAPSAKEGFFFASEPAKSYASKIDPITGKDLGISEGGNVIPAHLRMKNPLVAEPNSGTYPEIIARAKARGNDGVIFKAQPRSSDPNDPFRGTEIYSDIYLVFEPSQIKSAIGNRGTYSRTSSDIRE